MAEVAARGGKGVSQLRGLDLPRRFKEECGQHERFEESEIVGSEDTGCKRFEAACGAVDREHGAFSEEGIDAHGLAESAEFAGLAELV
jgi:hypothetical protein